LAILPLIKLELMKHSLHSSFYPHIDAHKFTAVVKKLRQFFDSLGFLEVHTQNRLSILAACEDPFNISTFYYNRNTYPLPQTGQMWLEHELLTQPEEKGFYCLSTSYRNEKNPILGRHCLIFPMFEFEFPGTMADLAIIETELLNFLGFKNYEYRNYEDVAKEYGVSIIDNDTEDKLYKDVSDAVLLMNFPERTNPFWNMKRHDDTPQFAKKIDVILCGQETIGSAERSCDVRQMRETFFTIEGGKYSEKLFELFGYDRVMSELNEFLSYKFFPRVGGGIGVTRLIRAMEINKLI
jgi:aspartyl/asparaginyl-tRNA synthetase